MKATPCIVLNDTQVADLREFARHAPGYVCERAHFVLLSHKGFSCAEISEMLGHAKNTVRQWQERFQREGICGLLDRPRSGRPSKSLHLTDVLEAQMSQDPPCFGYLQAIWTIAMLMTHLCERFRFTCSRSTVRRGLAKIRYSWHRPKLSPAQRPDPLAEERRAALDAALAENSGVLLAADECDMCLLAILRSMWQRIGEQARLPTPGQNAKIGVFGAINLRTGLLHAMCSKTKRSSDFIQFMEMLLVAYPADIIRIVIDNASIHHSALTRKWLALHPRIVLICLPTYSGHQLNPIEKVWWLLKQHIASNRNFKTVDELRATIQAWLSATDPPQLLALINCAVTRRAALAHAAA